LHLAADPDAVPREDAELYPQFFAITALGFATGLRPSSLRPLRRQGDEPDVVWDENILFVRRSQTIRASRP
jgi:hypothetical protein